MKTKIAVLLSLLLVVATLFSSCAEESAQKQFTSGNFSITLDECFDMEKCSLVADCILKNLGE